VARLHSTIEIQSRIRELIKLAKEQGYLTFDDLNETLPEGITDADELDLILTRLRRMEIDIIEASEVDRYKDGKKDAEEEEEEEEKTGPKLDILDDPVRMYLKQMGQVPLLTRELEVEISKRIEEAESMVQKHINRFGFVARAHLDLARKLAEGKERFDRVILDKKNREPGTVYEEASASVQAGGAIERLDQRAVLPDLAQFVTETIDETQISAKSHRFAAKGLSLFLLQAESHGGICSPGRRRLPYCALPSDGVGKASSRPKKTFTTPG
jgi:hypothetical protein